MRGTMRQAVMPTRRPPGACAARRWTDEERGQCSALSPSQPHPIVLVSSPKDGRAGASSRHVRRSPSRKEEPMSNPVTNLAQSIRQKVVWSLG